MKMRNWLVRGVLLLFLALATASTADAFTTLTVATCDSAASSKALADFVGNCDGDQTSINAAISALPSVGGTVRLMEGHYDIKAVANTLGGILIDRSNVTLEGLGFGTRLRLADNQHTNVIRVVGDGTSGVIIQHLYIDGNSVSNYVSNFEACGVKAASTGTLPVRNITVQFTSIVNAARLNVMLNGVNMRILGNHLGDAGSDVAEILTGPGEMVDNYVEISATTGHALGTDTASTVRIANNTVRVLATGRISQIVFRFWGGQYRNILANNQVYAEGPVAAVADLRGYFNVVTGNIFSVRWDQRSSFMANSGTVVTGNIFQNIDIAFQDTSGSRWPITLNNNFLYATTIAPNGTNLVQSGNVSAP